MALFLLFTFFPFQVNGEDETFFASGVPHCVDRTETILTDKFVQRISDILDKEAKELGGSDIAKEGKHILISDCEIFYTVVLVSPPTKERGILILHRFITIYFFWNEFLPPELWDFKLVVY